MHNRLEKTIPPEARERLRKYDHLKENGWELIQQVEPNGHPTNLYVLVHEEFQMEVQVIAGNLDDAINALYSCVMQYRWN